MFKKKTNFAKSKIATAPSPATSGTSLVVTTGEGALFPALEAGESFWCTVWPPNTSPLSSNAEIILVTARSTDTFTIDRAEQGTTARSIDVDWNIANTITMQDILDAEAATMGQSSIVPNEVPTGLVNGSNALFTLSQGYVAGSLMVFRDGQLMYGGGNDYTETDASAGTFTFVTAPATGSVILVTYKTAPTVNANADTVDGFDAYEPAVEGALLPYRNGWHELDAFCQYSSADDPTYVMTSTVNLLRFIYPGVRIEITQGASVLYFICTKSENVAGVYTVSMFGGTDFNLANATIDQVRFSSEKAPLGFPLDPAKWTMSVVDNTLLSNLTPSANTWFNWFTMDLPIGCWNLGFQGTMEGEKNPATDAGNYQIALSTTTNSVSDAELWGATGLGGASGDLTFWDNVTKSKIKSVTAKTTIYLNSKCSDAATDLYLRGDLGQSIIRAICAYL